MKKAGAALLSFAILSCGGGSSSLPSGGSTDLGSISLNSVSVDKSSISEGGNFTVSWNASYSSLSGLYFVVAYLSPNPSVPSPSGNYQLFSRNCGQGPLYECDTSGSVQCTYVQKLNGYPVFDCGYSSKSVPFTGKGYIVLKACAWLGLDEICDTKAVSITVN